MALKECTKKEQANSYELEVNVDGDTVVIFSCSVQFIAKDTRDPAYSGHFLPQLWLMFERSPNST